MSKKVVKRVMHENDVDYNESYRSIQIPLNKIDPKYLNSSKNYLIDISVSPDYDGGVDFDSVEIIENILETDKEYEDRLAEEERLNMLMITQQLERQRAEYLKLKAIFEKDGI